MNTCIVVRSGDRALALPIAAVEEVVTLETPLAAPGVVAAVRGVVAVRGKLLPVAHLGAMLADAAAPPEAGTAGLVVASAERRFVLEVDEAVDLVTVAPEALPHGWRDTWASTAVRTTGTLVPVIDLEWVAGRLTRPVGKDGP